MANETQIIVNKRSIRFIDTTTKQEYFSTFIDHLRWKRDKDDNFTFFNSVPIANNGGNENNNRLGVLIDITGEQVGVSSFVYTTTFNPDTGIVFVSADVMETWLGNNTGFYFDPNPIGVVVDITGVLTSVAHDSTLTGDGTVGDPLSVVSGGGSGVFTPTINSTNMVEVSQESDFGTPDGSNNITLVTNTTYFIRGTVTCVHKLVINTEGIVLLGWDRDKDELNHTGTGGDFITVNDVNFEIANLKLSSTNSAAAEVVLRATNFNYGAYNDGRLKILTIINCQFRNCFDVHYIEGFDLVDIQQSLFWYIKSTTIGCQFRNISKLQISSCEYVRWFDESTIPTPSGYATTSMVEILSNGSGNGNGAVNISGCILHPQQTQNGIDISATSTTGFGTISGNTFINIGLTTGLVSILDYDIQNSYIIQANQGLINANSKGTLSIVGNLNDLDTGTTNPQVLNEANVGGSFTNTPTFPVTNRVITRVQNCSFTYNNKNNGNFFVSITGTVEMSGDGFIACRVRSNGTAIPFAIGYPEIRQGRAQNFSFSVIGSAVVGDVFDVEFESFNTSGVSTPNDILVREFVLNGYQF